MIANKAKLAFVAQYETCSRFIHTQFISLFPPFSSLIYNFYTPYFFPELDNNFDIRVVLLTHEIIKSHTITYKGHHAYVIL